MFQQSLPTSKSIWNYIVALWKKLTDPIPSLSTVFEQRQAQLLSILTLILSILFVTALLYGTSSVGIFFTLFAITLASYFLSRTKYYRAGNYLFTYALIALPYVRIFQGEATSIEAAVVTTVHISLVIASVLLSKRGFIGLVIIATIATFTAPLYSTIQYPFDNIGRVGGIVFSIGLVLYGINVFRENLEREQSRDLFNSNLELEEIKVTLEKRIDERTLELQKSSLQIQAQLQQLENINKISQEISSSVYHQPNEMLAQVVKDISEKLGYYHVGIFLLDEKREYSVLQAANSSGGQKMLANHHQLKVGGTGVVGYVSQSGRPRIALDTGADAVYFNNPFLPETRSEISLPLKFSNSTIGVLDVQSTQPAAFNEEDINTLMTIANQLAAILFAKEGFALPDKASKAGQQLNQPILWENQSGYSFSPDGSLTTSTTFERSPVLDKVIASGETMVIPRSTSNSKPTLAVPVKFRDQVIGVIQIESAEMNRSWSEDEVNLVQSISDRAAFALENARLFENATRRAEQEETISRVTTQIGSSTDFERILQTTIQELGLALGASRSFIQIGTTTTPEQKVSK